MRDELSNSCKGGHDNIYRTRTHREWSRKVASSKVPSLDRYWSLIRDQRSAKVADVFCWLHVICLEFTAQSRFLQRIQPGNRTFVEYLTNSQCDSFYLSPIEVENIISSLSTSKALGPHNISVFSCSVYCDLCTNLWYLCVPMYLLFLFPDSHILIIIFTVTQLF